MTDDDPLPAAVIELDSHRLLAPTPPEQLGMPYYRWQGFSVGDNGDGTFHLYVDCDSSGYIFADQLNDEVQALWFAQVLNAALDEAEARRLAPPSEPERKPRPSNDDCPYDDVPF